MKSLVLSLGWLLLLVVGCSAELEAPAAALSPDHTAQEVEQLFVEWACPANPAFAQRVYQPNATEFVDETQTWLVETRRGEFTVSDSAGVLAPSDDASTDTLVFRQGEHCATSASRRP